MENSLALRTARFLPKIRRRLPEAMGNARLWLELQDWLIARHHLAPARNRELDALRLTCRTPDERFDFAGRVFPSHQIRAEILGFMQLAQGIVPRMVVEIGTAEGGTNFLLSALLPTVKRKISVDLFVQNTRLLRRHVRPDCEQLFICGSSYAPETVETVRRALGSDPIDVLFIDGDHRYDGAKADFERYAPMVRGGGLIAFHDIVDDYRTRFGRATGNWAGDVPKLWREVRPRFKETWEFVQDREQDGLGIGVLRWPGVANVPLAQ